MQPSIKLLMAAVAAALFALTTPRVPTNSYRRIAGCEALDRGDSLMILQDTRNFASATDLDTVRINFGIPTVPEDSVRFINTGAACDSAANSYRLYRIARGDPDSLFPVALLKIGSSGKYFGNAPAVTRAEREYVILDSLFHVQNSIRASY